MTIIEKIYELYEESFSDFRKYEMTFDEIKELEAIVYDMTCSCFPLGDFMNDARKFSATLGDQYDYQQAMKDLCLIVYNIKNIDVCKRIYNKVKQKRDNARLNYNYHCFENKELKGQIDAYNDVLSLIESMSGIEVKEE